MAAPEDVGLKRNVYLVSHGERIPVGTKFCLGAMRADEDGASYNLYEVGADNTVERKLGVYKVPKTLHEEYGDISDPTFQKPEAFTNIGEALVVQQDVKVENLAPSSMIDFYKRNKLEQLKTAANSNSFFSALYECLKRSEKNKDYASPTALTSELRAEMAAQFTANEFISTREKYLLSYDRKAYVEENKKTLEKTSVESAVQGQVLQIGGSWCYALGDGAFEALDGRPFDAKWESEDQKEKFLQAAPADLSGPLKQFSQQSYEDMKQFLGSDSYSVHGLGVAAAAKKLGVNIVLLERGANVLRCFHNFDDYALLYLDVDTNQYSPVVGKDKGLYALEELPEEIKISPVCAAKDKEVFKDAVVVHPKIKKESDNEEPKKSEEDEEPTKSEEDEEPTKSEDDKEEPKKSEEDQKEPKKAEEETPKKSNETIKIKTAPKKQTRKK